jgi:hypothetical protein
VVVSLPEHAPRVSGKRQPIGNSTGGRSASLNYVSGKTRWRSADVLADGKTITSHSTPGPLCCHSGPSGGVGHPGFCQGLELLASFSGVPKILRAQGTKDNLAPLARTRSRPGNSDAMEAQAALCNLQIESCSSSLCRRHCQKTLGLLFPLRRSSLRSGNPVFFFLPVLRCSEHDSVGSDVVTGQVPPVSAHPLGPPPLPSAQVTRPSRDQPLRTALVNILKS